MDLAAVFALSLLGCYFFVAWWRLTAYATRRFDGHHLYFRAAFCGVIFFALALAVRVRCSNRQARLILCARPRAESTIRSSKSRITSAQAANPLSWNAPLEGT